MDPSELPAPPWKYASTMAVGRKGQIVPEGARQLFGIRPGDTLLLLADLQRGIAIMRQDCFQQFVDQAMSQALTPPGDPR